MASLAILTTNAALLLGASAVAMRLAYPVTNDAILQVSFTGVALAAAGALTRFWSRHWIVVAVPAALVSLVLIILIGMETYLGDGGNPSIMWQHVPGTIGVAAALVMTASTLSGWALLGKVKPGKFCPQMSAWRRRRTTGWS